MKAPVEHGPPPLEDAVQRPGEPSPDALHAARQGLFVLSLDDHVGVVALERIVDDAEAAALLRFGERALELTHQARMAERRETRARSQRDVDRAGPGDLLSLAMQHSGSRAARASCAVARSASARVAAMIVESELPRPSHAKE